MSETSIPSSSNLELKHTGTREVRNQSRTPFPFLLSQVGRPTRDSLDYEGFGSCLESYLQYIIITTTIDKFIHMVDGTSALLCLHRPCIIYESFTIRKERRRERS